MKNEVYAQNIETIIAYFGNQTNVARKLGVSSAAVSQWVGSGSMPINRILQAAVVSKGDLSVEISESTVKIISKKESNDYEI